MWLPIILWLDILDRTSHLTGSWLVFIGWAFAVMFASGVQHVAGVIWRIRWPPQKCHCTFFQISLERIGMDLVRPSNQTVRGHCFVLVWMDYATHFPEAVHLCNISVHSVGKAFFCIISQVGIQKEMGTMFMLCPLCELYGLFCIKSICTSVYHLQANGQVKRLTKHALTIIYKFIHRDVWNWNR